MKLCWWVLPSLVAFWLLSLPAEAARLTYWRFNAVQSRLDIVTDDDIRPKAQLIANPSRLVIDLPGTALGRPTVSRSIGSFVREVRVGQLDRQTTRMVVELGPAYTLRPQEVKVQGLAPNRWTVQLPKLQPLSATLPFPKGGIAISVPPPKPYPKTRVIIAVDPGHGGPDVGAVGVGGLQEKRVVLPIALEVAKLLEKRGMQAVLTRSDDRDVDLPPRVARAEGMNATVFVSIHANSISLSHPEVNGLETYYYSSGYRLAQTIHNSILRSINIRDRGVRQARFYVLRKTSMPSVLVEVGFVTGREDGRNLASATYRSRMAQAIVEGILQYFR